MLLLKLSSRKFDIGIYTVITSITPLRVYVWDGEAQFRFCAENYYPFDAARLSKYVVKDDYTPLWKVASWQRFTSIMCSLID